MWTKNKVTKILAKKLYGYFNLCSNAMKKIVDKIISCHRYFQIITCIVIKELWKHVKSIRNNLVSIRSSAYTDECYEKTNILDYTEMGIKILFEWFNDETKPFWDKKYSSMLHVVLWLWCISMNAWRWNEDGWNVFVKMKNSTRLFCEQYKSVQAVLKYMDSSVLTRGNRIFICIFL